VPPSPPSTRSLLRAHSCIHCPSVHPTIEDVDVDIPPQRFVVTAASSQNQRCQCHQIHAAGLRTAATAKSLVRHRSATTAAANANRTISRPAPVANALRSMAISVSTYSLIYDLLSFSYRPHFVLIPTPPAKVNGPVSRITPARLPPANCTSRKNSDGIVSSSTVVAPCGELYSLSIKHTFCDCSPLPREPGTEIL